MSHRDSRKTRGQVQEENGKIRQSIRKKIGNLKWTYLKTEDVVSETGLSSKTVGVHIGRMILSDPEFGFEEWATGIPRTWKVWIKQQWRPQVPVLA